MRKQLLSFVIVLGISGCATSPILVKDAGMVPSDRILRKELPQPGDNVRVLFVRDVGMVASAVYQHLYIDGREAALLNPGEKVEFFLLPGEHIFGVVPTDVFGTNSLNTIDQDLKAGKNITTGYRQTAIHFGQ